MPKKDDKIYVKRKMNDAATFFKSKRKKVQDKQIPDTAHFRDISVSYTTESGEKVTLTNWTKLNVWLKENAQQTAKISGISALWLLEYLTRIFKTLAIDNKLLTLMDKGVVKSAEAIEQKKNKKTGKPIGEKPITKFTKKHPWVASYLVYYMLVTGMVLGGGAVITSQINKHKEGKNQPKKEQKKIQEEKAGVLDNIDQKRYAEQLEALDRIWPKIAAMVTFLETYYEESDVQSDETRATSGFGLTYEWYVDENGELKPREMTKGRSFSKSYNFEQVKAHLIVSTLQRINPKDFSDKELIALCAAGFQRPADMRGIAKKIKSAKSDQEIADAFMYYGGEEQWKKGTLVRRWWCAAYALGKISDQEILKLPRDAFSRIFLDDVRKNNHFVMNDSTVNYAIGAAKKGKNSTVKDFLKDFKEGRNVVSNLQTWWFLGGIENVEKYQNNTYNPDINVALIQNKKNENA